MRRLPAFLLCTCCLLLAACAAPATTPDPQAATPVAPPAAASTASKPAPAPASPLKLDTSCRSNADCAVKNVGNCCGAMPACVNANATPDPAAVQAQCRASGRMSVCGFREISACQCNAGTCEPAADAAGAPVQPAERVM